MNMNSDSSVKSKLNQNVLLDQFVEGKLFSNYFLIRGIQEIEQWSQITDKMAEEFLIEIVNIFKTIRNVETLTEPDVEDKIINPILTYFGFFYLRQGHIGRYIPDYALYRNENDYIKSRDFQINEQKSAWDLSICLLEAKRGDRSLDSRNPNDRLDPDNPSNKIISYLENVWRQTNRKVKFAFLTNGKEWRVYARDTDLRSKRCISFKLDKLAKWFRPTSTLDNYISIGENDKGNVLRILDIAKLIIFFLSVNSHIYDIGIEKNCNLDIALSQGYLWQKKITDVLKKEVFEQVIPLLSNGMADNIQDVEDVNLILDDIYNDVIIILYRILFIMYAEDRNLLPVDSSYYAYSMRKMRIEIAQGFNDNVRQYSSTSIILYGRLNYLFDIINKGDEELKINMYNGKLFDRKIFRTPNSISLSDKILATVLELLSRDHKNVEHPIWINYADLSVKHLGSIYESLLGFNLKKAICDMGVVLVNKIETVLPLSEIQNQEILETIPSGKIYLTNENSERKSTGSYFTPDYIVRFITEETIGPTLYDFKEKFEQFLMEINENKKNLTTENKFNVLEEFDPIERMLNLHILDPAVGSGHFLVYAFEFISEWVEEILNNDYVIDNIKYIFTPLRTHNFNNIHDSLNYLRRLILKRCVYGVDINYLAIELTKLSLWLSSFTPEFPLSFLDHHIKVGNSLLGLDVEEVILQKRERKAGTIDFFLDINQRIGSLSTKLIEIADLNLKEVYESEKLYGEIENALNNIKTTFNYYIWSKIHRQHSTESESALKSAKNYIRTGNFGKIDESLKLRINNDAQNDKYFHYGLEFIDMIEVNNRKGEIIQKKFDFIITNPPYGGKVKSDHKKFLKSRYDTHHETAAYFMKKTLNSSTNYGIILPKTISFYKTWLNIRRDILKMSNILHVMDTGLAFEDVNYETIILIGTRKVENYSNSAISIAYPLTNPKPKKAIVYEGLIPYDIMRSKEIIIFRAISEEELQVVELIENNSISLGKIVRSENYIFRGVYIPDSVKKNILRDPMYVLPKLDKTTDLIWINKVPNISEDGFKILQYYKIALEPEKHKTIIKKSEKTMVPRIFLKVLRGDRLVAYPDIKGNLCTTEKLVNIVIPQESNYSLNFLSGIINSPYPSFYLSKVLFSKTTETSRVMDYPYSSLIPIPDIKFGAEQPAIDKLKLKIKNDISSYFTSSGEGLFQTDEDGTTYFIHQITYYLNKNFGESSKQGIYIIIDFLVKNIIDINNTIKDLQFKYIQFLLTNYEKNSSNFDVKKVNLGIIRKMGYDTWPSFKKKLQKFFILNSSEFSELSNLYNEFMVKIVKKRDFVELSHQIINELARISYNLTENQKEIVLNNLKPRVQKKTQF